MSRRRGVIVAVAAAAALVAGVTAIAYDRWRCPSQAELERARGAAEVVAAFADRGIKLSPTSLPAAVVGATLSYRVARAYRYVTPRAAVYVLVYRRRCVNAPGDLRETPGPRRSWQAVAASAAVPRCSATTSRHSRPTTTGTPGEHCICMFSRR